MFYHNNRLHITVRGESVLSSQYMAYQRQFRAPLLPAHHVSQQQVSKVLGKPEQVGANQRLRSSLNKRRDTRKKRAEHRSTDDVLPGTLRAVSVPTGGVGRRGGGHCSSARTWLAR